MRLRPQQLKDVSALPEGHAVPLAIDYVSKQLFYGGLRAWAPALRSSSEQPDLFRSEQGLSAVIDLRRTRLSASAVLEAAESISTQLGLDASMHYDEDRRQVSVFVAKQVFAEKIAPRIETLKPGTLISDCFAQPMRQPVPSRDPAQRHMYLQHVLFGLGWHDWEENLSTGRCEKRQALDAREIGWWLGFPGFTGRAENYRHLDAETREAMVLQVKETIQAFMRELDIEARVIPHETGEEFRLGMRITSEDFDEKLRPLMRRDSLRTSEAYENIILLDSPIRGASR